MWNKIIQKYKQPRKKVAKSECMINASICGRKAVVVWNGEPVLGIVTKVTKVACDEGPYKFKAFVTVTTEDKSNVTFEATSKLSSGEFKLISNWVYEKLKTKSGSSIMNDMIKPTLRENTITVGQTTNNYLSNIQPGELVETVILSGMYKGIWIRAKVRDIEEETMNLHVLRPLKWRVAGLAVGVPKRYIRPVSSEDKENYIVPVKFVMDDQVLSVPCSKQMTIEDFKKSVSLIRGVQPNQLIFVNRGTPLLETGPIPDDTIFCVICQKGGLTNNQLSLLVSTARRQVNQQTQGKFMERDV